MCEVITLTHLASPHGVSGVSEGEGLSGFERLRLNEPDRDRAVLAGHRHVLPAFDRNVARDVPGFGVTRQLQHSTNSRQNLPLGLPISSCIVYILHIDIV